MDQDSVHMVAASKVPMLKPGEYELWRIRMEQYIQMVDYALWEVIENGNTAPNTTLVEGVEKVIPPTTTKEKAKRRLELKARSTLLMGIPNEHQLKFNSIKDAKSLLQAIKKSSEVLDQTFDRLQKLISQLEIHGETISQEDMNQKFLRSLLPEWNTHTIRSKGHQNVAFVSSKSTSSTNRAVTTAHGATTTSTQATAVNSTTIDNLSDAVICAFFVKDGYANNEGKKILEEHWKEVSVNGTKTIGFDMSKVECYNFHKRGYFARECRAPRNQENRNMESIRRSVPVESTTSNALISCDGLGLESVEARLLVYKKNESVYEEDIKLTVEKFENLSKNINKLLDCQIVDKYKTGLGYNAVPPPYTGNFMPPKHDLSFSGLEEFINEPIVSEPTVKKHVVETSEAKASEAKSRAVRKNNGSLIIEDWVSDSKEEYVPQAKKEKKTVKPSFAKIEFVKSKEQVKSPRNVKQGDQNRKNTHTPRGNQRNWNNRISQRLGSNFEMINKACYMCGSFDHLQYNCDNHQRQFNNKKMVKLVWNYTQRANHQNYSRMTHPSPKRNMVPKAVLLRVNTVKDKNVNTAKPKAVVNTARPKAVRNAVKGNQVNAVKASACWVWKPKTKVLDYGNPQMDLQDQRVIDSGCSRHMTGNMSYLMLILTIWSHFCLNPLKVKTVNGEVQLQALVDGKKIIITEASVRRDLQINDEEGTDFLPNATIFKELTRMGPYTPTMVTTPAVVPQQRILTVIPAKHQSRQTAQEMRKPSRVQQGESLNIQDVKTNLFWEFGQFTSHDGETIESYYTRFYKMMNEMIRNNLTVATMQVNVQFPFNNFKPNGQDLSHCEATTQLDEVSYHKLFRHSETIPKGSIMNTVLKRMAKNAKPISTLSHAATRYKGKEIAKPITPPSESASEEDSDPEQAQKDKDMQKNLALIANALTARNLVIMPRMQESQNGFRDLQVSQEIDVLCKQAEKGVQLQAEQSDWLADTDEEIDEQELEAHYSYMAKIQEVPNADSGTDAEPLEQVHYDTDHNVFANDLQHLSNLNLISNHEHGNG
ncbi:hypothetical protein Tco_1351817 [Tanacetum coccineum]